MKTFSRLGMNLANFGDFRHRTVWARKLTNRTQFCSLSIKTFMLNYNSLTTTLLELLILFFSDFQHFFIWLSQNLISSWWWKYNELNFLQAFFLELTWVSKSRYKKYIWNFFFFFTHIFQAFLCVCVWKLLSIYACTSHAKFCCLLSVERWAIKKLLVLSCWRALHLKWNAKSISFSIFGPLFDLIHLHSPFLINKASFLSHTLFLNDLSR